MYLISVVSSNHKPEMFLTLQVECSVEHVQKVMFVYLPELGRLSGIDAVQRMIVDVSVKSEMVNC